MKLRNILFIALFILLVAVSTSFILSEQSHNLEIVVKTNGTDVQIQPTSNLFFTYIPPSMKNEMEQQAINDVYDDKTTVDSLKSDMKNIAEKYNYTVTVKVESQFGTDQLPMPATVKGTSMLPTLHEGQDLIVLKTSDFKVGDIVVARHPQYGLIVKRVAQINGDQVYLMSDNRQVIVEGNMISKGLDTWLPISDVVGVVKQY
ncbi:MAG TPA: S24/S26 family peptidase [Methanobacterium sp.]|nr:S24/S26 family peptidase [Methanobacterium sp.]